jgi:hypothetical protein
MHHLRGVLGVLALLSGSCLGVLVGRHDGDERLKKLGGCKTRYEMVGWAKHELLGDEECWASFVAPGSRAIELARQSRSRSGHVVVATTWNICHVVSAYTAVSSEHPLHPLGKYFHGISSSAPRARALQCSSSLPVISNFGELIAGWNEFSGVAFLQHAPRTVHCPRTWPRRRYSMAGRSWPPPCGGGSDKESESVSSKSG